MNGSWTIPRYQRPRERLQDRSWCIFGTGGLYPFMPLALDDDQLCVILQAAAPLPIEHRPRFVSDVAAAIAVTGTADVAALILKIQRSHLARVMHEMPCTDEGDCNDRWQG